RSVPKTCDRPARFRSWVRSAFESSICVRAIDVTLNAKIPTHCFAAESGEPLLTIHCEWWQGIVLVEFFLAYTRGSGGGSCIVFRLRRSPLLSSLRSDKLQMPLACRPRRGARLSLL